MRSGLERSNISFIRSRNRHIAENRKLGNRDMAADWSARQVKDHAGEGYEEDEEVQVQIC